MCWPLAFQAALPATQHNRGLDISAPDGDRPDPVFKPVVVDGHLSVVEVTGQRRPALEAVIERFGGGAAVRDLLAGEAHPLVEGIGEGSGPGLPCLLPCLGIQIRQFPLHLVEPADVVQGCRGHRARAVLCQVEELAPGVGHAASLGDALGEAGLVAGVVVADEGAAPVPEEGPGMFAGAALGEVVDHALCRFEGRRGVGPKVSPVGFFLAGAEHLDRGFVGVQHRMGEQFCLERIDQRLELHPTDADPLGQGRAGERHPGPGKDAFLAVERQMVSVFGDQHVGQEAGGREALVDDLSRHRCLNQALTGAAGPFAAHMALDREDARGVVELLADVLADALHLAAAGTGGGIGFVADLGPRQFMRQRRALGLARWAVDGGRAQALQFLFNGSEVRGNRFLEQQALARVKLFGAAAELPALQDRHLMGELVDLGLAKVKLPILVGDLLHQRQGQRAQLLRIEVGKGGGFDHGHECAAARGPRLFMQSRIAWGLHHRDDAPFAHAVPRQAQHQRVELSAGERKAPLRARRWPHEAPLVESPGDKPQAEPIAYQHLHARAPGIGEEVGVVGLGATEGLHHPGQ